MPDGFRILFLSICILVGNETSLVTLKCGLHVLQRCEIRKNTQFLNCETFRMQVESENGCASFPLDRLDCERSVHFVAGCRCRKCLGLGASFLGSSFQRRRPTPPRFSRRRRAGFESVHDPPDGMLAVGSGPLRKGGRPLRCLDQFFAGAQRAQSRSEVGQARALLMMLRNRTGG